jgi:hypothetical protein
MMPMNTGGRYDGPERRETPRYKVNFQVRWGREEREPTEGVITDLSSGGCFIVADDLVEEGYLVKVEIEVPGQQELTLWGHVAYWIAETGFAVKFVPFAQGGSQQRLEALLASAGV